MGSTLQSSAMTKKRALARCATGTYANLVSCTCSCVFSCSATRSSMRSEAPLEVAKVLMSSSSSRMFPVLSESSWRMRS